MEFLKSVTNIDFVSKMRKAIVFSIVLLIVAIGSLIYHGGPDWGVEFTGGTEIHIKLTKDISISDINKILDSTGYPPEVVQQLGLTGDKEYLIRFSPETVK
ncbi:MAG: protein translocase subunit SecF, partial [Phycisphaerae bacterium]|nr:protein translocase subunit SecF [Phycisphaerae bacterium]NIP54616.1 protein translocase subunit SecF [Phycisphaerae bacterium]NIX00998.1 protein translocase subunit SecF [Phycisphaerae bacterium]NIX30621.1 protein translocase subunit SecF [Phycisphaerae bacterium]